MEITFKTFPVTDVDYIAYFQKTAGPGRETPNFLFTGFIFADRAGKKQLQALLRTVIISADYAEEKTGKKAIHNLVFLPIHRLMYTRTFGIKIQNGFAIVPSLKVSGDFDERMPMQQWGWFEAAIRKAIEMVG